MDTQTRHKLTSYLNLSVVMNWRWGHLFSFVLYTSLGRAGQGKTENRASFYRRDKAVVIQPWAEAAEVKIAGSAVRNIST